MMNKETTLYTAERLFTGDEWLYNQTVTVANKKIIGIAPSENNGGPVFPVLAPAFMDIQIYGAYGKLLAVYPETGSLHALQEYCRKGGASHFQPTVATNEYPVFYKCIDTIKAYWAEGGRGCLGLHIEGPWIHPLKRGAHSEKFIHAPSMEQAQNLLEYGKGIITMITLAPEVCNREVVDLIKSYGVIISAGHSNSSYEEAANAFDEGIPLATHLFNAMSPLQHRAPGMVGAIFQHPKVMASVVPDGYHVDFSMIRLAKRIMGDRLFAITDAVTETTEGPYPHHLNGDRYESEGILSGSALTMGACLRNLINKVGIEPDEALRMVSLYPAKAMQWNNHHGKIAIGYDASMVMLSNQWEVIQVVTEGITE